MDHNLQHTNSIYLKCIRAHPHNPTHLLNLGYLSKKVCTTLPNLTYYTWLIYFPEPGNNPNQPSLLLT